MARRPITRQWIFWFNGALVALGLALALIPSPLEGPIQAVIAGGFVGSGITNFFGSLKLFDSWAQMESTLSKMSRGRFASKDDDLKPVRLKFHHYYVTSLDSPDGSYTWRHQVIDFRREHVPGSLLTSTYYRRRKSKKKYYLRIEAGIRDTRLVAIARHTKGVEPADVFVYPFMSVPGEVSAGIEVRQTVGAGYHAVTPGLLTTKPIAKWRKVGTVTDRSTRQELNSLWRKHFLGQNHDIVVSLEDQPEVFSVLDEYRQALPALAKKT